MIVLEGTLQEIKRSAEHLGLISAFTRPAHHRPSQTAVKARGRRRKCWSVMGNRFWRLLNSRDPSGLDAQQAAQCEILVGFASHHSNPSSLMSSQTAISSRKRPTGWPSTRSVTETSVA